MAPTVGAAGQLGTSVLASATHHESHKYACSGNDVLAPLFMHVRPYEIGIRVPAEQNVEEECHGDYDWQGERPEGRWRVIVDDWFRGLSLVDYSHQNSAPCK